jgi:hypothetical protein
MTEVDVELQEPTRLCPAAGASATAGDVDLATYVTWDLPLHYQAVVSGYQVDGHPIGREERRDWGTVFIEDRGKAEGGHERMASLGIDLKRYDFQAKPAISLNA